MSWMTVSLNQMSKRPMQRENLIVTGLFSGTAMVVS